jgi:hypothetical protein
MAARSLMRHLLLSTLAGVALAMLAAAPQPARAMDFFTVKTPDGRLLLVAEGEIKEGDDRRLHDFVAALPAQTRLFAIGLDSPAGTCARACTSRTRFTRPACRPSCRRGECARRRAS